MKESVRSWKNPSGVALLIGLAIALIGVSLGLDWQNRREWQLSFTLPLLVCAILSAVVGYIGIPLLRSLKARQYIREDGPQTHLKKAGTPTMGGLFFIPIAAIVPAIWAFFAKVPDFDAVLALSLVTLGYGFIGWIDDWQVIRLRSNKGISPRMKLALQIAVAVLFCLWLFLTQPANLTNLNLPFGWTIPLGFFFWVLAGFTMVGESNATNLTDGVDGLAAGTCAIAFLGLGILISATHPGLMIFCAGMAGSCLGFVVHNRNKAKVFMGDTGSLALGGAIAAVAIFTNHLWELFILSGLFFVETVSVIAQVGYYKATKGPDGVGKRLFKMSPFHNHLELSGWTETQIVGVFYLVNLALVALSLGLKTN